MITSIYLFVITSQYVYYFFGENDFVLTIYWGVLSFLFLNFGMNKNIIKYRTIGLYILSLAILKIVFLDIWSGLNSGMSRVVALMVVGVIMIGISLLYTRKYGGNLKGEFDLVNLIDKNNKDKKAL